MTNIAYVDDAQARIVETIKLRPIALFMKGGPSRPQCGFSTAVVQTLAHHGVPYHTIDVLADPTVRQAIKTFSPALRRGRLRWGQRHRSRNAPDRRTCGSTRCPSRHGCIMTGRTATRWALSEAIFGGRRSSDPAQSGRVTPHQATGVPR